MKHRGTNGWEARQAGVGRGVYLKLMVGKAGRGGGNAPAAGGDDSGKGQLPRAIRRVEAEKESKGKRQKAWGKA